MRLYRCKTVVIWGKIFSLPTPIGSEKLQVFRICILEGFALARIHRIKALKKLPNVEMVTRWILYPFFINILLFLVSSSIIAVEFRQKAC